MTTRIHIIAKREGKVYGLDVDVEAKWQPLDVGVEPVVDLMPEQLVQLDMLPGVGNWLTYHFPDKRW